MACQQCLVPVSATYYRAVHMMRGSRCARATQGAAKKGNQSLTYFGCAQVIVQLNSGWMRTIQQVDWLELITALPPKATLPLIGAPVVGL